MTSSQACPCGSGLPYDDCCGPYHRLEREAPTTTALLRARYAAFVLGDEAYLRHSWHPAFCPAETLFAGEPLQWRGLEILRIGQGAEQDSIGQIEYVAHYSAHGRPGQLHESARYQRLDGRWVYTEGDVLAPLAPDKIGRNTPCPCGSGKKYKKCCGR